MLKANRVVALATAGRLANNKGAHRGGYSIGCGSPDLAEGCHPDLLGSLSTGLHRLCELAFAPTDQIHQLATKAVSVWVEARPLLPAPSRTVASRDARAAMRHLPGRHPPCPAAGNMDSVRLLTAIALYLELCTRDRACVPTGAIAPETVDRLIRSCGDSLSPQLVGACPALRRLLKNPSMARPPVSKQAQFAAA